MRENLSRMRQVVANKSWFAFMCGIIGEKENNLLGFVLSAAAITIVDDIDGADDMVSFIIKNYRAEVLKRIDKGASLYEAATMLMDLAVCGLGTSGLN